MKKTIFFFFIFLLFCPALSWAELIDRGGGLIYDTDLDITWLQDANYAMTSGYNADGQMNWTQATTWAANLSYYDSVRDQTLTGWRLPTTPGTSTGYLSEGEMGHLFYIDGVTYGSPSPFINIQYEIYWYGTEYAADPTGTAWIFYLDQGYQNGNSKGGLFYAWAVRDGDVVDTTPDQFTFTDQTGVTVNTVITSNTITVSGLNAATPISILGGTYAINGGSYTSANGTVSNGSTVRVQQTSSGNYSTTTDTTLTIGGVSDIFSVTTEAAPEYGGDINDSSSCFIATAAFGSYMEPHVMILREFRDQVLSGNPLGRSFVFFYYKVSPPIANFISQHDALKMLVRWILLPVVGLSWMALNIGPIFTLGIILVLTVLLFKVVPRAYTRYCHKG
jgi:hypothetical protein